MKKEKGYYWYRPVLGDPPEFEPGRWFIVEVRGGHAGLRTHVVTIGRNGVWSLDALNGAFDGPLRPPS